MSTTPEPNLPVAEAVVSERPSTNIGDDYMQSLMQDMPAKSLHERLQDLGFRYGCPPGVRVLDWLEMVLKERNREVAKRSELLGGSADD